MTKQTLMTRAKVWGNNQKKAHIGAFLIAQEAIDQMMNPEKRNADVVLFILGKESTWGDNEKAAMRFLIGQTCEGITLIRNADHKSGLSIRWSKDKETIRLNDNGESFANQNADSLNEMERIRFNTQGIKAILGIQDKDKEESDYTDIKAMERALKLVTDLQDKGFNVTRFIEFMKTCEESKDKLKEMLKEEKLASH